MTSKISALERARADYEPRVPTLLREGPASLAFRQEGPTSAVRDEAAIRERFPRTFGRPAARLVSGTGPAVSRRLSVGVVLSGGQAPGGHNVIAGLSDALGAAHAESRLFGFLGGPKGILEARYQELTPESIRTYRNTGGFDMIGGGRDKIESPEQLAACRATCERLALDGLVIVGGDDSNTNAALIAESFVEQGVRTAVVGVPKTIDGDMRGQGVEMSFGFDTATRLYSELIGNICRDARSAGKYWHFIKLMGRNASHVALECALATHPNVTLIGEEAQETQLTLGKIVELVADVVRRRAEAGRHYGVCLIPEGLIEFIPEIRALIGELNRILSQHARYLDTVRFFSDKQEFVNHKLSKDGSYVFSGLPTAIQQQLLLERDAHGNVQVSKIDTEAMLVENVEERIAQWTVEERFPGRFQVQHHFFGYEGRCSAPSNFDADYTYSLGRLAALTIAFDMTGYICALRNLAAPPAEWQPAAIPLTSMMQMETRKGKLTPVIGKALVRTGDGPFRAFAAARERWAIDDDYIYPGPLQYFGPDDVCNQPPLSLLLEAGREP